MNLAHFRPPTSVFSSIPSSSPRDSILVRGDGLALRICHPGEKPMYLHYRSIDSTHWSGAMGVMHSAQMGDFISSLAKKGSLKGIRVTVEGNAVFQIGNFQ